LVPLLEGMDNLCELWVRLPSHRARDEKRIIEVCKLVLLTSKAAGRKELRIQHLKPADAIIIRESVFVWDRRVE
jgi:hypothetical protein